MSTRVQHERVFHDQQAARRARALRGDDYAFADESYLEHETWISPAFAELGNVCGQRVLELGCGHGMASVVLARKGAIVTACDLSIGYLREARRRCHANHVDVGLLACDGHRLPCADASFDGIWGNAILHHLDLHVAAKELHRVLAPGGLGVFCEPWAGNRLLDAARASLPYPGKQRTIDEVPLTSKDLDVLRSIFPNLQVRGHQFLSMLGRVVRLPALTSYLVWCDGLLLHQLPHWQRYCRYVMIVVRKEA